MSVPIDSRGGFEFRDLKLRKMADNTFLLHVDAPPNAPRVVSFSALCLDCFAGPPAGEKSRVWLRSLRPRAPFGLFADGLERCCDGLLPRRATPRVASPATGAAAHRP